MVQRSNILASVSVICFSLACAYGAELSDGDLASVLLSRLFRPELTSDRLFYKASNMTPPDCPSYTFKYEDVQQLIPNPKTYVVPHTKIVADNVRCGKTGSAQEYMWLIPSSLLADKRSAELGNVLEAYELLQNNSRFKKAFENLVGVDPLYAALEMSDRYCGDTVMWAKDSVFIFILAERKLINFGRYGWIHDGEVAMLGYHAVESKSTRSRLCIYKDSTKPGPGVSPIPSPSPFPQTVASPSPNAFAIFPGVSPSPSAGAASSGTTSVPPSSTSTLPDKTTTTSPPTSTSTTVSKTSTATSSEENERACFPSIATAELQSGEIVPMHRLKIGDKVRVGASKYSEIFMFTHKLEDNVLREFVYIETESGEWISLSSTHYLYVGSAMRTAGSVRVGDFLTLADGQTGRVIRVETVLLEGLYNPQTVDGRIVVNSILASTYTTAVPPQLAHALLAPLRLLHKFGMLVDLGLLHKESLSFLRIVPTVFSVLGSDMLSLNF